MSAEQSKNGSLSVASVIRELRFRLGETQMQFAVRTGLALSTLARYETGIQRPKPSILKILCAVADDKFPDLTRAFNEEIENRAQARSYVRVLPGHAAWVQISAVRGHLQRVLVALERQESTTNGLRDAITRIINDSSISLAESSDDTSHDDLAHPKKRTKTGPGAVSKR
jgi:transcriptional regulator with XRE-family HTH domain